MIEELVVEELIEKTATGMTEPFVCRLSDDHSYIVKGRGATKRGLISELIAALLAKALALPIPAFTLATVSPSLVNANPEARSSIGSGIAFGSRQLFDVVEVDRGMLTTPSAALLRRVFLFDYWIANSDRSGSMWGGNSNILMETGSRDIAIIDHNLAFEENCDPEQFRNLHICSDFWFGSPTLYDHAEAESMLRAAFVNLNEYIDVVPEEWREDSPGHIDRIKDILRRFETKEFWMRLEP